MDTTALVDLDIEGGHALVNAIKEAGLPVAVAAWLHQPQPRDWRLFIASPDTQTYGPKVVYEFVRKVIETIQSPVHRSLIAIANTTNHFVNDVPVTSTDLSAPPIRFRGTYLKDEDVDDGFIYLVDRTVKPSKTAPRANASILRALRSKAA